MLSPNRQPNNRKQPNEALLRVLRRIMLVAGGIILVLGLLLIILPTLQVKSVVVEGNSYCTSEQIIAASQIEIGDELLEVDLQNALDRIFAECPNVETCSVSISFPFTVKIKVTEKSGVMYTAFNDQYISFDRSFRVLEMKDNGETAFSPFLYVKLPAISGILVGSEIVFAEAEADRTYVGALLEVLEGKDLMERVTYVDFSERFSLSFILDAHTRVELGKLSDAEIKLNLASEILSQKNNPNAYAVVDVSNVEKPTYQTVAAEVLFD